MLAGQFRNSCRERVLKDMKRRRGYSTNRNRIKSRKGFSLTEMLVTVLLMSLATLAVAAGVTAAVRTYRSMTLKSEAQTLLGTAIASVDDDFASADLSTLSIGEGGNEASFFSGNRGYEVHIHNEGDTIYLTDAQGSSSDSEDSKSASVSGAIPIVTTKTRTQNLKLQIKDISITPSASETSGADKTDGGAPAGNAETKLSDSNPYFTYTITVLHGNDKVESETVKTAVIAGYPTSTDSRSDTGK